MFFETLPKVSRFTLILISIQVIVLFSGAIFFSYSTPVKAQDKARTGLVITPALYELEAERGNGYDIEINLLNDSGGEDYKINTLLQGFTASANEGVPVITDLPSDSKYLSWVTFKESSLSIKNTEKITSHIRVNVPQDAEPGSHYLALTYIRDGTNETPDASKPLVKIESRIAVMLFLNIKGQVQRDANFEFIQADKNIYDPLFDGTKIQYRIKLSGNAYLKPSGNIFVGNESAQPDASLRLNPEGKIILPNSARSFELLLAPQSNLQFISSNIPSQDEIQKDQISNGSNIFYGLSRPWFGEQKVEARVLYINSQNELTQKSATVSLFFFPWKTLLLLSPILLIIVAIVFWRYRKHRKMSALK